MDRGRGDGFVARAGVATLLKIGTFERRAAMRRMVAEAEEGQELCEAGYLPMEAREGRSPVKECMLAAVTLARWLYGCPAGPLAHHSEAAWGATAALARGWASTVAQALGEGPLTLEQLRGATAGELPPERLLRYLEDMERAGLVEAQREGGGEPRYAATEWLREGAAAVLAAARMEWWSTTENIAEPDGIDVRAILMLALPRMELPSGARGTCRFEVDVGEEDEPQLVVVTARIEDGRAVEVEPGLGEHAHAWAFGAWVDWMDALVAPGRMLLHIGGQLKLSMQMVTALSRALFGGDPYEEPPELEPADRGAERRREAEAGGREEQLDFLTQVGGEIRLLREEIEAHGQPAVEAQEDITIVHRMHIFDEDLSMLCRLFDDEASLVEPLVQEMTALARAWGDTLEDEPYV